jgi:Flp pilus assembly protein TadG
MPSIGLAARFMRDRSGAYAVMFGLMAPVFIGTLALGSETGLWYSTQAKMQGAAESSAISAAVGLIGGDPNVTLEANATAHPMALSTAQAARWLQTASIGS